tara:strand:- start:1244 stop:2491 length:1248 start_codon:yes stop_codon:yes gene_type:complete
LTTEKINLLIQKGQEFQNKGDYYRAYYFYKRAFRQTNDIKILFVMIDLVFYSQKSGLLINQNLKYKLLENIIDYAFNNNSEDKYIYQLFYYKLRLFREFNKMDIFKEFAEENNLYLIKYFPIEQEIIHFFLETKNYNEAEKMLKNLSFDKSETYNLLKTFFIDKISYEKILEEKKINFKSQKDRIESIKSDYEYIVLTSGNYEIFLYEMTNFFISLKKSSSKFLLTLYIHDTDYNQKERVKFTLENLNIENYIIIFEDNFISELSKTQIKAFYTANRYIISKDLLTSSNKPVFIFDADTIIYKDLLGYVINNNKNDFCLAIKKNLRYAWTYFSAPHSIFYPTANTKKYLNLFEKYTYYCIKHNLIRWHVDQLALYVSFIMMDRFDEKLKITNNSEQYSHKDSGEYFRHMHHIYKI